MIEGKMGRTRRWADRIRHSALSCVCLLVASLPLHADSAEKSILEVAGVDAELQVAAVRLNSGPVSLLKANELVSLGGTAFRLRGVREGKAVIEIVSNPSHAASQVVFLGVGSRFALDGKAPPPLQAVRKGRGGTKGGKVDGTPSH